MRIPIFCFILGPKYIFTFVKFWKLLPLNRLSRKQSKKSELWNQMKKRQCKKWKVFLFVSLKSNVWKGIVSMRIKQTLIHNWFACKIISIVSKQIELQGKVISCGLWAKNSFSAKKWDLSNWKCMIHPKEACLPVSTCNLQPVSTTVHSTVMVPSFPKWDGLSKWH